MERITRPPIVIHKAYRAFGFNLGEPVPPEGTVEMSCSGMHTFIEGIGFHKMCEGLNRFLAPIGVSPSMVECLLVVLESDKATFYVNDMLDWEAIIRSRRRIEFLEPVANEDIAGIDRVKFKNATIPENAGVVLIMSWGWRKGFFFDTSP